MLGVDGAAPVANDDITPLAQGSLKIGHVHALLRRVAGVDRSAAEGWAQPVECETLEVGAAP
jgi:hypothetical protein